MAPRYRINLDAPAAGLRRSDLARRIGAWWWGPGRLAGALRQARSEGRIRGVGFRAYVLAGPDDHETRRSGRGR